MPLPCTFADPARGMRIKTLACVSHACWAGVVGAGDASVGVDDAIRQSSRPGAHDGLTCGPCAVLVLALDQAICLQPHLSSCRLYSSENAQHVHANACSPHEQFFASCRQRANHSTSSRSPHRRFFQPGKCSTSTRCCLRCQRRLRKSRCRTRCHLNCKRICHCCKQPTKRIHKQR